MLFLLLAALAVSAGAVDDACESNCKISLVESVPWGLTYPNDSVSFPSTYDSWLNMIAKAEDTIEIASFYWTMTGDSHPSAKEGETVFEKLIEAGRDRKLNLKVVQSSPSSVSDNENTKVLAKEAGAQVRTLNFTKLVGSGVLHTKFWIVDHKHVYVGSANMDWRALTQVKELGFVGYNCSCIARDLKKIFDVYWSVGLSNKVPSSWPKTVETKVNLKNPMALSVEGNQYKSFIGSSPPPLSPKGRTSDIDGLLYGIETAEKFIYISVMDFAPLLVYSQNDVSYWPIIDNALRKAAIERRVNVRLLISKWKTSRKYQENFLKSLEDITGCYSDVKIEVKRFIVPDKEHIPFTRVNHNKYMVTDKLAYIGTSNWIGDYFTRTAGIGVVFEDADASNKNSIRQQLVAIHERDWFSPYAKSPANVTDSQ